MDDPICGLVHDTRTTTCEQAARGLINDARTSGTQPPYGRLADAARWVLAQYDAVLQSIERSDRQVFTRLQTMLEQIENQHVIFDGPDGEVHPNWCRECRIDALRRDYGADVPMLDEDEDTRVEQVPVPVDLSCTWCGFNFFDGDRGLLRPILDLDAAGSPISRRGAVHAECNVREMVGHLACDCFVPTLSRRDQALLAWRNAQIGSP